MNLLKNLVLVVVYSAVLGSTACKNKSKDTNSNVDTTTTKTAPVQIETDDVLRSGIKDATKDYPGVTASVSSGEITLTGEITRDKLPKLMQSLNSLHPKKITNNLTIK